jgi:hypothetical protein
MLDPIPSVEPVRSFGYVPSTASDGNEIAGGLVSAALGLTQTIAGGGVGGLGGLTNLNSQAMYAKLLSEQTRIQQETLVFNAKSNMSKSEHDTKKSIVNNWRAG